eukprot:UN08712
MKLASSIDTDINEASKLDRATLERKLGPSRIHWMQLLSQLQGKADLRGNISKLEDQLRKAKKKLVKKYPKAT